MAFNTAIVGVCLASILALSNALQCYQCGQYNDGVGSITPCLNYSEKSAHLHLKDCPRSSDKYCIVSTIRGRRDAPKVIVCLFAIAFFPVFNANYIID